MAEASAHAGATRGHPPCASIGLTLLVLIIVAAVFQLRAGFSALAPSFLTARGWTASELGWLFAVVSAVTWIATIGLAVVATHVGSQRHMGWFAYIMSPGGRASRAQYWLSGWLPLALATLLAVLPVAAGTYAAATFVWGHAETAAALTLSLVLPYVVTIDLLLLWPSFAVLAKRLHDRGKSAWFILISLIPVIGPLWLLVEVGFLPGQQGDNRYGPDPLARVAAID